MLDVRTLGKMWWKWHFASVVFFSQTLDPCLMTRKCQTNSNWRTFLENTWSLTTLQNSQGHHNHGKKSFKTLWLEMWSQISSLGNCSCFFQVHQSAELLCIPTERTAGAGIVHWFLNSGLHQSHPIVSYTIAGLHPYCIWFSKLRRGLRINIPLKFPQDPLSPLHTPLSMWAHPSLLLGFLNHASPQSTDQVPSSPRRFTGFSLFLQPNLYARLSLCWRGEGMEETSVK